MKYTGHGERRNVYKILVAKLEGNRPPGRPDMDFRYDNIKMIVEE
jgi:hypothetical protein